MILVSVLPLCFVNILSIISQSIFQVAYEPVAKISPVILFYRGDFSEQLFTQDVETFQHRGQLLELNLDVQQ